MDHAFLFRLSSAVLFSFFFALKVAGMPFSEPIDVTREVETHIPKRETGVIEFLREHPGYDGRDVVIAVFDTGVDPAAAGLQKTTTGERKIVDVIDGSGSGDVDASTTVELAEGENELTGLTGRTLILPEDIVNPTGVFHLGWKGAEELFYGTVLSRIREKREREWQRRLNELRAERTRQRRLDEAAGVRPASSKPESDLSREERDLLARETLLETLEKNFRAEPEDMVFDCVVWHDGEHYNVLVDTGEDGDLRDETILRPFGVAGEYGYFSEEVGSSFAVQVYDEGNLLSIVTVSGSHGTHVGAIAAAHFPEDPSRNGIAPGARILSIKIGDVRLGGSSNRTGEMRAVAACVNYGVDIMNASWGGRSVYQDGNNMGSELYRRLVEEYGVTAFVSAGNNGPALSTLGSPGGETPAVIGVGAYVSAEMGRSLYAVNDETPDTAFQFSSRGPAKNGYLGVDIMAPGGAIAPVSFDSLAHSRLMNGTSMAAPSAAGVGAILISAAKQLEIEATPPRVRAALMNSARRVEGADVWAQGPGLIRVGPAVEHLRLAAGLPAFGLYYDVVTPDNTFLPGPGLYVRNPVAPGPMEVLFQVSSRLPVDASPEAKFAFHEDVVLVATEPWVRVPRYLHLTSGSNAFRPVLELPEYDKREPAEPLYAEIHGFLAGAPEAGPLFRIPLTVVRPIEPENTDTYFHSFPVSLTSGELLRRFYHAPHEATHLRLRLRRASSERNSRMFMIHALSLTSHQTFGGREEFKRYVRMNPGQEEEFLIPVLPGRTAELVLHQLWNSLGTSDLNAEVDFIGVHTEGGTVYFSENQQYAEVPLVSTIGDLNVNVSAQLTEAVYRFAPAAAELVPLDERDLFPAGPRDEGPHPHFAMRQRFEFTLPRPMSMNIGHDQLPSVYEQYGGGLIQAFNGSGHLVWQGAVFRGRNVSFPKGKIVVYRDFRALSVDVLEKASATPLVLRNGLGSSPNLPVYANGADAVSGRSIHTVFMREKRDYSLLLEDTSLSTLKSVSPSPAYFSGSFTLSHGDSSLLALPIVYRLGDEVPNPGRPPGSPVAKEQGPEEGLIEEIFNSKLLLVKQLRHKHDEDSVALHERLLSEMMEEKPEDAVLYYEKAIAMASRSGLLSTWNGSNGNGASASGQEEEEDAGEVSGDEEDLEPESLDESSTDEEPASGKGACDESGNEKPYEEAERGKGERETEPDEALDIVLPEEIFAVLDSAEERIGFREVAFYFGAPPSVPEEDAEALREYEEEKRLMTGKRELLRDVALLRSDILLNQGKFAKARTAINEAIRWEPNRNNLSKRIREQQLGQLKKEEHWGLALELFHENLLRENPHDRNLLERRIALYEHLGWSEWAERERLRLAIEKNRKQPTL